MFVWGERRACGEVVNNETNETVVGWHVPRATAERLRVRQSRELRIKAPLIISPGQLSVCAGNTGALLQLLHNMGEAAVAVQQTGTADRHHTCVHTCCQHFEAKVCHAAQRGSQERSFDYRLYAPESCLAWL